MVLHGRLCGRVDNRRLFFVFVLGWRTYCVSCATHVVETYVSTPPRTFELASLYLHPAKHKKVFLLRIDTHKINPVGVVPGNAGGKRAAPSTKARKASRE